MPDASPAAAPAAPAGNTPSSAPGAPKAAPAKAPQGQPSLLAPAEAKKAPTKAAPSTDTSSEGESDWGEADDTTLADLLKRKSKKDPSFRLRHKGEEKGIESLDDLKSMLADAQRGKGASKVVEEANKKAAAAEQLLSLREALESDDPRAQREAFLALAGEKGLHVAQRLQAEAQERQELESQLTEQERALWQENQELRREREERQAVEKKAKQAEEAKREKANIEALKKESHEGLSKLVSEMKLPPEKMMGPLGHHLYKVMREAAELGQAIGTEVPAEVIAKAAQEDMRESTHGMLDALSDAELYDFHGPERMKRLLTEVLRRRGQGTPAAKATPAPSKQAENEPQRGTAAYLFGR